ncbi:MAG TPA: VOC family protein [Thermoleophilia bacterium]|nr:VOC family protein [Thermoleophilia bacterium]
MFSDSHAFAGFSVDDIAAARTFYADVLGLDVSEANGMLTLQLAGGGRVLVYPKPDHEPATFTVLNLPVDDIEAAVDGLVAAGVEFERYEGVPHDDRGIVRPAEPGYGPPIAWFTDPAGNVLSVLETGARPEAEGAPTATDAGAGPRGPVSLQLSVYPLRQPHLRPAIQAALRAAAGEGVDVIVGRLSTFLRGDEAAVFAALRAAFSAAASSGSTVAVATLASGAPADETVAELQEALGRDATSD